MLLFPEDGLGIEEVLEGVPMEVSMVPTDAVIIHTEEADIPVVDTEAIVMGVMVTVMVVIAIAGGMEAATIADPDMEIGMDPIMETDMVDIVDIIEDNMSNQV